VPQLCADGEGSRAINAQQLASRFRHVGRCVPPLFCRIRGAVGKEKGV